MATLYTAAATVLCRCFSPSPQALLLVTCPLRRDRSTPLPFAVTPAQAGVHPPPGFPLSRE
jgi:hypothetical protein